MREFNENIKKILQKFSYDLFIVQQDFDVKCTCLDYTSKQPDPFCPKCLSTGSKIKIKKIQGASSDTKGTFRNLGVNESSLTVIYYIDAKYPVYERNVIVDEDEVYVIHRLERKRTANKETVYQKVYATYKKSNVKAFLKNFDRVVGR
ncbi:hypothetical protein [Bacillus atrophaeus]|uniref:hypothetical protein n=1 Tax=Bacillus atrophaeus TaxID=1452 RepID=UPI002E21EA91|nr:hypothetical protein [Bacillus atrophaeus]